MIPKVIPPLTELTVLVTRPAAQAGSLCEQIEAHGGAAIAFPAIEIEPLATGVAVETEGHDLIIFLSVNAVANGAQHVRRGRATRIAAIGKATAAALAEARMPADIVPAAGFDSEALLAHPELNLTAGARVLIVHGEGGRDLLRDTLVSRGMVVDTVEVYRRVRPAVDEARRAEIETRWSDEGIDVVTLTSAETLHNLLAMLTDRGRELLSDTPLLVASKRIIDAAAAVGLRGTTILAAGADDTSMIGALARWRTRARV